MKKRFAVLMAGLMVLSLASTALADMVWEPDNAFYRKHQRQCESHDRRYYANGPKGFVTFWDAPDGSTVQFQQENGAALWIYYIYEDWGCTSVRDGGNRKEVSGWVPMKELYLIYDHISFEEEYGEHFEPYDGQFDTSVLKAGNKIWLWEHPFAREPKHKLPLNSANLGEFEDPDSLFSHTYTDRNGRVWGYTDYLCGTRDCWVLLENPACEGVKTSSVPEADDLITSGEIVPPKTPVLPTVSYLPYFLVAGVVAVTAVLLVVMKRRKSRHS